jgi:hypothetical protein
MAGYDNQGLLPIRQKNIAGVPAKGATGFTGMFPVYGPKPQQKPNARLQSAIAGPAQTPRQQIETPFDPSWIINGGPPRPEPITDLQRQGYHDQDITGARTLEAGSAMVNASNAARYRAEDAAFRTQQQDNAGRIMSGMGGQAFGTRGGKFPNMVFDRAGAVDRAGAGGDYQEYLASAKEARDAAMAGDTATATLSNPGAWDSRPNLPAKQTVSPGVTSQYSGNTSMMPETTVVGTTRQGFQGQPARSTTEMLRGALAGKTAYAGVPGASPVPVPGQPVASPYVSDPGGRTGAVDPTLFAAHMARGGAADTRFNPNSPAQQKVMENAQYAAAERNGIEPQEYNRIQAQRGILNSSAGYDDPLKVALAGGSPERVKAAEARQIQRSAQQNAMDMQNNMNTFQSGQNDLDRTNRTENTRIGISRDDAELQGAYDAQFNAANAKYQKDYLATPAADRPAFLQNVPRPVKQMVQRQRAAPAAQAGGRWIEPE